MTHGTMSKRKTRNPSAHRASRGPSGGVRLLEPELIAELEDIAEATGCELVHAEFKGGVLRLFIDRPEGGVDLSDCERISKHVSALLDVVDFSDSRYVLEVSSPGLDRELYRPRDWERFTGHRVRVTFTDPDTGDKRTVIGRLEGFAPEPEGTPAEDARRGRAEVWVDDTGEHLVLSLDEIRTGRLEVEL
jgi:ribosome maturation factor RimP